MLLKKRRFALGTPCQNKHLPCESSYNNRNMLDFEIAERHVLAFLRMFTWFLDCRRYKRLYFSSSNRQCIQRVEA